MLELLVVLLGHKLPIKLLFIIEPTDLNATTFTEDISYHVTLEYGPLGGHLKKLSSEIYGKMYHSFEMDWSRLGEDLEEALEFQCAFAKVVCVSLDARFVDNDLISYF